MCCVNARVFVENYEEKIIIIYIKKIQVQLYASI